MRFTIDGSVYEIDKDKIVNATKGIPPNPFDGRNKYYVKLHGSTYPIKQPIHLVTGLPYTGCFTAQYAYHILTKLGFMVNSLPATNGIELIRSTTTVESAKKFAITLEEDEDGFIVASCPALPGCHSQGRTDAEAIANIREAIRGYIASMRMHGEPVPAIKEVREVEVVV